jgi:drug/metabolite transporter (DMT)-like permease
MSNSEPKSQSRAFAPLTFGAVCISFAPIFVKLIAQASLGPTSIAFWRCLFGACILFAWAVLAGKRISLPWPMLRWTILAGFLFCCDLFVWHRSILFVGAGMATILGNTQVFATAVLSFLFFKEHLSAKFFVAAVSGIVGVALLVGIGSDFEFTSDYNWGVFFGLATGIFYAHYIIVLKIAGRREDTFPGFLTLMAWVSLFSALFLGVISAATEAHEFLPPDLFSWFILISLALVAQSVGWWAISSSLPKIETHKGGLALLLQPVLATAWGALFFAEYLTIVQLTGAVITLLSIYVGIVQRRPKRAPGN